MYTAKRYNILDECAVSAWEMKGCKTDIVGPGNNHMEDERMSDLWDTDPGNDHQRVREVLDVMGFGKGCNGYKCVSS
jgi:hypothetical protein